MQRIDTGTKAVDLFGAGKHGFKDGNQSLGISATELNAALFNAWQEEICNVIEGQGTVLDSNSRTQLDVAIRTMLSKSTVASAGAAPAFTLTPSPAITSYLAGQRYRVKFHASGTTGSNTLNVSAIGVKSLKQYDAFGAKVAAMVVSGQIADVEYDGTDMVLLNPLMVDFSRAPSSAIDYQRLPSGLILQWGVVSQAGQSTVAYNLPLTFPVAAYIAAACKGSVISTTNEYSVGATVTTTQITITNSSSGTSPQGISWFSIGK